MTAAPPQVCPVPSRSGAPSDPYAFLNSALRRMQECVGDDQTRLRVIRDYLGLHLVIPARELLGEWMQQCGEAQELRDLESVCRRVSGGGPTSWSTLERQFRRNLTAIGNPECAKAIQCAWEKAQSDYQLFIDVNRLPQVRRRKKTGAWQWFPRLGRLKEIEDAISLPEDIGSRMPGPYLFDGLGFGRFFERIHAATQDTFLGYSCPLYIVESQIEWVAALMHLHDWTGLLHDPRVYLLLGEDCLDQLQRAWDVDHDLPLPNCAFTMDGDANHSATVQFVQQAADRREKQVRESLAGLEEQYAGRNIGYWSRRFGQALDPNGYRLRILAAVSSHTSFLQHSMRDARRALEALGHEVRVLTEDRPFTVIGPLTYHKAIREFDPDVFLMLDHLRPECAAIIPTNLPILTWDQDQLPHVFTRENLTKIAPHDFIAGCSKLHCINLGCNPRQLLNSRVPTCPEQFGGDELSSAEWARYRCDVSYVSHASQTPKQFHEEERRLRPDDLSKRLLDTMYALLPQQLAAYRVVDGGVMSAVFEEACRRCNVTQPDDAFRAWACTWYLWRLGDRMFRHEALQWVAHWAARTGRVFRIYGNGWEKHPTLSPYAAGPANNGRELICIYRASSLNLQLMPAGFVHQRALDGLSAGGFFLGRTVPGDLQGIALRMLVQRIDELDLGCTDQLLNHPDSRLRELIRAYVGDRLGKIDPYRPDLLTVLRVNAELAYPDEVFPDFRSILFDSAEEFEQRAEAFLADAPRRAKIAAGMREAVIRHYSYQPAMRLFLESMRDYLTYAAGAAQS